jgi:hypothetical protein
VSLVREWLREEGGGDIYRWAEKGMVDWTVAAKLDETEIRRPDFSPHGMAIPPPCVDGSFHIHRLHEKVVCV